MTAISRVSRLRHHSSEGYFPDFSEKFEWLRQEFDARAQFQTREDVSNSKSQSYDFQIFQQSRRNASRERFLLALIFQQALYRDRSVLLSYFRKNKSLKVRDSHWLAQPFNGSRKL